MKDPMSFVEQIGIVIERPHQIMLISCCLAGMRSQRAQWLLYTRYRISF